MIIAVSKRSCAVSNSAEGGDVESKSCSLFMINDQNFLAIFVVYLAKPVVHLAICHVFKFCRVFSNFRRVLCKTQKNYD